MSDNIKRNYQKWLKIIEEEREEEKSKEETGEDSESKQNDT